MIKRNDLPEGFEIQVKDPLAELFNLPTDNSDNTVPVIINEPVTESKELSIVEQSMDDTDHRIDGDIKNIQDMAIHAFKAQSKIAQMTPPKYAADAMSVAAKFLDTALQAGIGRAKIKTNKDKLFALKNGKPQTVHTTNNVLVTGSRLEVLRSIKNTGLDVDNVESK